MPTDEPQSLFSTVRSYYPSGNIRYVFEAIVIIAILSTVFYTTSGTLTPLVSVPTESMAPQISQGDAVYTVIPSIYANKTPNTERDSPIITKQEAREFEYTSFGRYGSVILFDTPGHPGDVLHRVHMYVEPGDNWVDNSALLGDKNVTCEEIANCPASTEGYITAGDNNDVYDQASERYPIVKEDDIITVATFRIPYIGWLRVVFSQFAS